jgi:hypothetical protein
MSTASTTTTGNNESRKRRSSRLAIGSVTTLDSMIGAHPTALRDIYAAGDYPDPATLEPNRARVLAVEPLEAAHLLFRPLVRTLLNPLLPWQGIRFESGGTAGVNRVLTREVFRFRCELADSLLDGNPTLQMRYDGLKNPWPVAEMIDELRLVGDGIAIGPTFRGESGKPLFWWGVSR